MGGTWEKGDAAVDKQAAHKSQRPRLEDTWPTLEGQKEDAAIDKRTNDKFEEKNVKEQYKMASIFHWEQFRWCPDTSWSKFPNFMFIAKNGEPSPRSLLPRPYDK